MIRTDNRWQTIFDAVTSAICLIDLEGKILDCNRAMLEFLDRSPKKIIGSTCWELVHNRPEPIEGCPFITMKNTLQRETLSLQVGEKWIEVTVDPFIDKNGNLTGAVHIITDITDRMKGEVALRDSQEFLSSVLDAIHAGIMLIDRESHTILDVNAYATKMIGRKKSEIIEKECHNFICPTAVGKCPITDLHQEVDNSEKKLVDVNGNQIPILKSVVSTTSMGKELLIESFVDITKQKNSEIERENLIKELRIAFEQVKKLSGLLPICASCKKIRDDQGYWKQIEGYIQEHSEAEFSHSICPDCAKKNYPDLDIHDE